MRGRRYARPTRADSHRACGVDNTDARWDNPTMTLIADAKKRVVLPDAAPGDVFTCEKIRQGMLLRRVYRRQRKKKMTKNEVLGAIRRWKYIPAMSWDELRKLTREP